MEKLIFRSILGRNIPLNRVCYYYQPPHKVDWKWCMSGTIILSRYTQIRYFERFGKKVSHEESKQFNEC